MWIALRRKNWLRGESGSQGISYLLRRADGKQCCLGLIASQYGITKETMEDVDTPGNLYIRINRALPAAYIELFVNIVSDEYDQGNSVEDTSLADVSMRINDRQDVTETEREDALVELFAEHGHTITFY